MDFSQRKFLSLPIICPITFICMFWQNLIQFTGFWLMHFAFFFSQGKMSRTWIIYNKPEEPNVIHAGLLLALGLHGHLCVLTITDIYQYYSLVKYFIDIWCSSNILICRMYWDLCVVRKAPKGCIRTWINPNSNWLWLINFTMDPNNQWHLMTRSSKFLGYRISDQDQETIP